MKSSPRENPRVTPSGINKIGPALHLVDLQRKPPMAQIRRETGGEDPFANFRQSLPWKARITLSLTQWFVLLRSKSWGNLVIVPVVVLGVLLAIPLAIIAFFLLLVRSIFLPRR